MRVFACTGFKSLLELLEHELKQLYDAEQRLLEALPKWSEEASDDLKHVLRQHLRETDQQAERLELVFENLGMERGRVAGDVMVGLIEETLRELAAGADRSVRDAALIAAAQRAEHYEIAAYRTARALARQLGNEFVAELLQQSLNEERAADEELKRIAEAAVNRASA